MSDLTVCKKCGWHALMNHERECWPAAGAAADRLATLLHKIPSTKLGYGAHRLTFSFDDNHSLTLWVRKSGAFEVDRVFWMGNFNDSIAVHLT
jgi:hypothetical protein